MLEEALVDCGHSSNQTFTVQCAADLTQSSQPPCDEDCVKVTLAGEQAKGLRSPTLHGEKRIRVLRK